MLFNFCIKGCIEEIVNPDVGCKIGHIKWHVIADADDIVLMAPSLKGLQKLIDILVNWIKNICLKINIKNSIHLVYKKYIKDILESSV